MINECCCLPVNILLFLLGVNDLILIRDSDAPWLTLPDIPFKNRLAQEVMLQLQDVGVDLAGTTVLDVGFGYGFNVHAMRALGAAVFGAEPDASAYHWAVHENKLQKGDAYFVT